MHSNSNQHGFAFVSESTSAMDDIVLPAQNLGIRHPLTIMGALCRKDRRGPCHKGAGVDTSRPQAYII